MGIVKDFLDAPTKGCHNRIDVTLALIKFEDGEINYLQKQLDEHMTARQKLRLQLMELQKCAG